MDTKIRVDQRALTALLIIAQAGQKLKHKSTLTAAMMHQELGQLIFRYHRKLRQKNSTIAITAAQYVCIQASLEAVERHNLEKIVVKQEILNQLYQ